jgi:hypothetical protein
MTFHIGSQTAGVINNVAGDQRVSGGQHGTVAGLDSARQAAEELRRAVLQAPLEEAAARDAADQVSRLEAELGADEPDPSRVAAPLERLTRLLVAAGPLAAAATSLFQPLHSLATWLGTAGQPVLRLLPLLA